MSDGLYRQEALDHLNRRLFGVVVLRSPPAIWLITLFLILFLIVCAWLLFAVQVETDDGSQKLIDWILNRPVS